MGHARGGRGDLGANRGVDWEPSQHSLGPAVAVNRCVRYAPYLPLRPGKRKPPDGMQRVRTARASPIRQPGRTRHVSSSWTDHELYATVRI